MLAGTQLMPRDVAHIAHHVGFIDRDLIIAVAVCSAESSRYTEADNLDANGNPTNPDGTVDYGLWQINSAHFGKTIGGIVVTQAACLDPHVNAQIAHALWQAEGWDSWAAFVSGAYSAQLLDSIIGVGHYWMLRFGLPIPGAPA